MQEHVIFKTTLHVLVSHLNYGNHLGYDALLSLLQEARLRWLKSINPDFYENNIVNSIGWLVKEVHLCYFSEAKHGDELSIILSLSNTTRTTFTLEHHVNNVTTGKELCRATLHFVCFDFEKNKISKIPVELGLTPHNVSANTLSNNV